MTRQHSRQTIVAACHAGVFDIVYRKATCRPLHTPHDFVFSNCAINRFCFGAQGWHLEVWNDHHHLPKVLLESAE